MTGMIDSFRGYVSMQECDEMGHMNIQHYIAKTAEAALHLRAALGLGTGGGTRGRIGLVALDNHIRFHREMATSDLVLVRSGVVEMGGKTATLYHEMREALEGRLSATYIVKIGCFDIAARRLVDWPEEVREAAATLAATPPETALPRALPPEALDRNVTLQRADALDMFESNRSAVNAWECDDNGHMSARFYMARISDSQGHMWAHAGLGRHGQAAAGLATATVEIRQAYFRELRSGDTMVMRTGLVEAGEKTLRYRHWLFNAETGEAAAATEGIGLLFDRKSRKSVPIPREIAERFGRGQN
ncbi:MAG: thioesterase family protein [Parvibaculum sp.]|uniref:thioesterase family protein n=1 Tax=Parvibaculum sp. TaxID=2024848 RepID=UPI002846FFB0|nr:thioesterase family protein [Parvibaculum sp.]MDR3498908.1 thioesterase family protein [Parvibaculum sp.]